MEISKEEYTELVRQSEQLRVIEAVVRNNKYISKSDITVVLGIQEDDE